MSVWCIPLEWLKKPLKELYMPRTHYSNDYEPAAATMAIQLVKGLLLLLYFLIILLPLRLFKFIRKKLTT